MTQKKVQNIFSKNLNTIMTLAETTREDLERELVGLDEKGRKELEKSLESSEGGAEFDAERLRVFDDLDGKIDTVLRRRLVCSDKFKKAVAEIKDAIKSGAFIINIVAPEYGQYKALVDLVLSEAMIDESQIIKDENISQETIENDREFRYDKMLGHIISDVSVHDFIGRNRNSPNLSVAATTALETIIQGGVSFDPNDPVNACDVYVKDYEKDPNAPRPVPGASATRTEGPRFIDRRRRERSLYSFQDPIIQTDFASPTFIPDSRFNVLYSDPMASPSVGSQIPITQTPPVTYYDEKVSLPLRYDPDVESSYEYPDMSTEVLVRETDMAEQIREMIGNGMQAVPDIIKQKWILFIKMLSALEGTKQVSFFHLAGFDNDGNPRSYSPEPGGGRIDVSVPEINPDDVERILTSFLNSIGISNAEVKDQMRDAVIEELQGGGVTPRDAGKVLMSPSTQAKLTTEQINARFKDDSDKFKYIAMIYVNEKGLQPGNKPSASDFRPWLEESYPDFDSSFKAIYGTIFNSLRQASTNVFLKTSVVDVEGKGENRVLGEMAYLASKELTVDKIKKSETLKSWISERFGEDYQDYWFKINKKLSVVSKNFTEHQDGFIIEAAARNVTTTTLYNRLFEIIRNNTTFKAPEPIKASITAEYVMDLLIKFLHKKCFESTLTGFESLKKKGIVPMADFGGLQFLTFPFPRSERLKFKNEDGEDVMTSGTSVLLTSKDGSRSEVLQIAKSEYYNDERMGPSLKLQFTTPPKNNYEKGNYVLTIQESSLKLEGLADDIYTQLYRQDAGKVKEQHKVNGVSLNLSIYPSWVPSPYDYRHDTASRDIGCGHPNNAYNIQLALNKRIALRERYMRKSDYREEKIAIIKRARDRLEQEIAEMRHLLGFVSNTVPTAKPTRRETYNSMLRNNSNPQEDPMFYKEVIYRCSKIGIDIGNYSPNINHKIVKGFLSPNDFDAFLAITKQVREEIQQRRNVLILRHVDIGLSTAGGNGFLSLGASEAGGVAARNVRTWNPGIQALVQNLHNDLSRTADPASRKTHIVVISEAQIPSFFSQEDKDKKKGAMKVVYLATNTISTDEIESLFQYYQLVAQKNVEKELRSKLDSKISDDEKKEIERKLNIISPKDENGQSVAPKITVPITIIRKAQSLLSNLGFQAVEDFVKKTCMTLVYEYSSGKKIGDILTIVEAQVKEDIETLKSNDEVLINMGIKSAQAKVTLNDYVTQKGTEWHSHVRTTLTEKVNKIHECTTKIDLLRRCLDLRTLYGNVSLGKNAAGEDTLVFRVPFTPNDSVGKTFWFDCDSSDPTWIQNPIDKIALEYARTANFDIQGEILDYAQSPSSEFREYVQRDAEGNEGIVLAKDLQNLSSCISSASSYVRQLEEAVKSEKAQYPTFMILEGDPGTGKSIFAEVLANCLDCKLLSSTFDEIFYAKSGNPNLRGGFEENVTRFFDVLTSLTDTVLLIDEIDKFLIAEGPNASKKNDINTALAMMQSRWETGASATSDVGKYEKNNLHIVLTTNVWQAIQKEHSALASRLKPKFEVHLPSDFHTLKTLFSGSAVINNLMNSACQGDPKLANLAKDLKNIYGNTDEKSKRKANDIIAKINSYDPAFFRRVSLICPSVADRDLSKNRSIPFTGSIDVIADFVNGWKIIENLIANLEKPVTREVDGQQRTFVPLDGICKKLSQILIHRSEKTGKIYARGNMRELMTVFKNLLISHQAYLSGENALPFNYKTLYAALSQTVFQFSLKDRFIEPEDREDLVALSNQSASDGLTIIKQFVCPSGVNDPMLPTVEFWYTEDNFIETYDRENEYASRGGVEKNNDNGLAFMMERIRENLLLTTEDKYERKDINYDALVEYANHMSVVSGNSEKSNSLKKFLRSYNQRKELIQKIYNIYLTSKDQETQKKCYYSAILQVNGIAMEFGRLKNTNAVEIFTAPQAEKFNAAQMWTSFSARLDSLTNSLSTITRLIVGKSEIGRTGIWEKIKNKNIEKIKKADEKIKYYSSWAIDSSITEAEWSRWVTENPPVEIYEDVNKNEVEDSLVDSFGDAAPFNIQNIIEFTDSIQGIKSEPRPKVQPKVQPKQEAFKPGFRYPVTLENYDAQAIFSKLHMQIFAKGDTVKILNPKGNAQKDAVFTVVSIVVERDLIRSENPNGYLITLSDNGGSWEPKDIVKASDAGKFSHEAIPANVSPPLRPPPPAAPTNDLADIDLGGEASITDYYFKIAMDIMKSRAIKKAQNAPIPQPLVKDDMMGFDIDNYAKAVQNRERLFSQISGTPFLSHTPTTSGSFIDDVNVMRIENPKTGPQNPGNNVPT